MKKRIYITAFVVFGILIQFLVHAGIEIWYIGLLIQDFPRYSFGLSWAQWFLIHHIGSIILFIGGILFGFWMGNFWWRKIYENKNLPSAEP